MSYKNYLNKYDEETRRNMEEDFKSNRRKSLRVIQDDIVLIARWLDLDPSDSLVVGSIMLWYKDAKSIHDQAEAIRNPDAENDSEEGE